MDYWSKKNLYDIEEQPLYSPKLTVWTDIASFGAIGPYFFNVSVNNEQNQRMLNEFLIPQLKRKTKLKTAWFQQDRAMCHMANKTKLWLQKHFHYQIILCNKEFNRLPLLSDLSCCYFFLGRFLKSKVYVDKPKELAHLRTNMERVTRQITPTTC